MIPADIKQLVVTKLDLGHISPLEARTFIKNVCGVTLHGRTRDRLVQEICRHGTEQKGSLL